MSALVESDRDKLIKVLRMFSSAHDGEVVSAARRAAEILQRHSLDWDELLGPTTALEQVENEADLIYQAKRRSESLSSWEQNFLGSISDSLIAWGRLTTKQRAVLDRIVNKLKLNGSWR